MSVVDMYPESDDARDDLAEQAQEHADRRDEHGPTRPVVGCPWCDTPSDRPGLCGPCLEACDARLEARSA